jgi:hypothetical protein
MLTTSNRQAGASNITHLPSNDGIDRGNELLCESADATVRDGEPLRPRDSAVSYGPDLAHSRLNVRRQSPAPKNATNSGGAHDVNEEMLAKAYRRGLRIKHGGGFAFRSLEFLLGNAR